MESWIAGLDPTVKMDAEILRDYLDKPLPAHAGKIMLNGVLIPSESKRDDPSYYTDIIDLDDLNTGDSSTNSSDFFGDAIDWTEAEQAGMHIEGSRYPIHPTGDLYNPVINGARHGSIVGGLTRVEKDY